MELHNAIQILKTATLTTEQKEALNVVLEELDERPSKSELDNLEWEFGVTLDHYEKCKLPDKRTKYAKALKYNAQIGYGLVYVIQDFIKAVKSGFFINSDGMAFALDANGKRIGPAYCDVKSLESLIQNGGEYVAWFNK